MLERSRYKITYIIIVSTSQADIDYLPELRATEPPPPAVVDRPTQPMLPTIRPNFPPYTESKWCIFQLVASATFPVFAPSTIFNIWSLSNRLRAVWLQYLRPVQAHSIIIFDAFPCHDFPAALVFYYFTFIAFGTMEFNFDHIVYSQLRSFQPT